MAGNEVKQKHPGGRPLKYKTPQELEAKINQYFAECDSRRVKVVTKDGDVVEVDDPRPYTLAGLALYLDVDTETLRNYGDREIFGSIIARAKQRCEAYANEELFRRQGSTKGVEFNLTVNHRWPNKVEVTTPPGQPIEVNSSLNGASEAELQEILRFVRQQTAEKH